jgi:putative transposase
MGRIPRAEFRGATYHVFARGNRRDRIFLDDEDYKSYLQVLRELAEDLGVAVFAFCLMPNHPHLCIRTDDAPLSVFMHRLNTRQAKRFNRKYDVRGHLYEDRYKALLVDQACYLLRLTRYIHQNPLRAKLVGHLEDWPFSSHSEYLAESSWIQRQPVLSHFSNLEAYQHFMRQAPSPEDFEIFSAVGRGFRLVGDETTVRQVIDAVEESNKPRTLWQPLGRSCQAEDDGKSREVAEDWLRRNSKMLLRDLQSASRGEPWRTARCQLVVYLRSKRYSFRSIAQLLNRDFPAVSRMHTRGIKMFGNSVAHRKLV